MQITDKLFKVASYSFITFITLIIVISFGMPDFLGKSALSDQFTAANVDGFRISNKSLAQERDKLKRDSQFGGLPDNFLEQQALERLIDRHVFYLMSAAAGLYPAEDKKNDIFADYLKANFSSFIDEQGFDFGKFEMLLRQNNIKLSEIEEEAVQFYTFQKNYSLLNEISYGSVFEALEKLRLSRISFNLRIVAFDSAAKEAIIKKKTVVSAAEIREQFNKEYLSKDKKAVLTDTKRDAIRNQLMNTKRSTVETEFTKNLKKLAEAGNLQAIASAAGVKVVELKQVTLADSLDAKKPKGEKAALSPLEGSKLLRGEFFTAGKKVIGPIAEAGYNYYVQVNDLKTDDLPSASELMASLAKEKDREEALKKAGLDLTALRDKIKEEHMQNVFNLVFQLKKNDIRIIRRKKDTQG